jgi:hypothetical protein
LSREIQEQQDQVRLLIKLGKEQGYLLYDQVNDAFSADDRTTEEIDSVFSAFESEGITLYEDASDAKQAQIVPELSEPTGIQPRFDTPHTRPNPFSRRKDQRSRPCLPARNGACSFVDA